MRIDDGGVGALWLVDDVGRESDDIRCPETEDAIGVESDRMAMLRLPRLEAHAQKRNMTQIGKPSRCTHTGAGRGTTSLQVPELARLQCRSRVHARAQLPLSQSPSQQSGVPSW